MYKRQVLTQANDNVNTALVQVLCVRVALAAVTHNGNGLSVQKAQASAQQPKQWNRWSTFMLGFLSS